MTLRVSCAFEVIKWPNERVNSTFSSLFLTISTYIIVEIGEKAHNTTASRPPVPCTLQILTIFNLHYGGPRVGLSVNNKQKVRQAMAKISRGEGGNPPPPPPQICQANWLDHRRVEIQN